MLVVSATDGAMPQMLGQIPLARQTGAPRIIVFINKCDVADDANKLWYDRAGRTVVRLLSKPILGGEFTRSTSNTTAARGAVASV